LNIFLGCFLLIFLPGYAAHYAGELAYFFRSLSSNFAVLVGFAAYLPFHKFVRRKWYGLETFDHELAHAVVSLLFFRRVERFVVTSRRGGLVAHSSGFGDDFGDIAITLAPYFFPTITLGLVLVKPFFWQYGSLIDFFIGLTFSFFAFRAISDAMDGYRRRRFVNVQGVWARSDVTVKGAIFSFIYMIFFSIFFQGIILAGLRNGYEGQWDFITGGALSGVRMIEIIGSTVFRLVGN